MRLILIAICLLLPDSVYADRDDRDDRQAPSTAGDVSYVTYDLSWDGPQALLIHTSHSVILTPIINIPLECIFDDPLKVARVSNLQTLNLSDVKWFIARPRKDRRFEIPPGLPTHKEWHGDYLLVQLTFGTCLQAFPAAPRTWRQTYHLLHQVGTRRLSRAVVTVSTPPSM